MKQPLLLTLILLHLITASQAQLTTSCHNDLADRLTINQPLAGERIVRYAMTPSVVPVNSTQAVLLEVTTTGQPSELRLVNETAQTTVLLTDNGTNGDKKAKDGIFSANVSPPGGKWSEAFLGFIRLLVNGAQVVQSNAFMLLLTADMPAVTPKKIDNNTQYSDYIFNIVVPSTADSPSDNNRQAYAKTFYKYHTDEFDFINYVLVPGFLDNRFHGTLNNNVQGIGYGTGSPAAVAPFGSAGRLIGYNQFPIPDFFDGANQGYIHEIAHQWINQSTKSFLKDGVPHWPISNLATAVMGYSSGATKQGSNFPYKFVDLGDSWRLDYDPQAQGGAYNDWELYLMGLLAPADVKQTAVIFKDQVNVPTGGTFPKTAFNNYTINDYIAIEGQRVPNAAQSQKRYAIATIVLSEALLTPTEMAYYDYMAKRAEGRAAVPTREGLASYMGRPFQVATGGRATLRALLNTNVNCANVPTRPTIGVSGGSTFCAGGSSVLVAPQSDTYIWYLNGVPLPDRTASLTATQAGSYALSVRNAAGCNSLISNEVVLSTSPAPAKPTITAAANGLTSSSSVGNQWLLNGVPIPNATGQTYTITAAGTYTVRVTNNGCTSESDAFVLTASEPAPNLNLRHVPNPASHTAYISFTLPGARAIALRLLSSSGALVRTLAEGTYPAGTHRIGVDTSTWPAGLYLYRLDTGDYSQTTKLVVTR